MSTLNQMCFVPEQQKIGKIADSPEESGAALDFPCGHSMDTSWFAVDAEGNVGLFDTSEDGALPLAAFSSDRCDGEPRSECGNRAELDFVAIFVACFAEACWSELQKLDQEELLCVEPEAALAVQEKAQHLRPPEGWNLEPCRVAVATEDSGRLAPEDRRRFIDTGLFLISLRPLTAGTIQRIATTGTKVFSVWGLYFLDAIPRDANKVFCFEKEHGLDPGLYHQTSVPSRPLKESDLPWNAVGRLRLPVRFKETAQLHLADFMKNEDAAYWDPGWALRWPDLPSETK